MKWQIKPHTHLEKAFIYIILKYLNNSRSKYAILADIRPSISLYGNNRSAVDVTACVLSTIFDLLWFSKLAANVPEPWFVL